jgi:hypothetical protein
LLNASGADEVDACGVVRDAKVVQLVSPRAGFYPYTEANVAGYGRTQAGDIDLGAVTVPRRVASVHLGAVRDPITAFGDPMLFPGSDDAGSVWGGSLVVEGECRQYKSRRGGLGLPTGVVWHWSI